MRIKYRLVVENIAVPRMFYCKAGIVTYALRGNKSNYQTTRHGNKNILCDQMTYDILYHKASKNWFSAILIFSKKCVVHWIMLWKAHLLYITKLNSFHFEFSTKKFDSFRLWFSIFHPEVSSKKKFNPSTPKYQIKWAMGVGNCAYILHMIHQVIGCIRIFHIF